MASTTEANFQDQLREIPWSSLPKTYQQAIDLTRVLGFNYIWIDSLCIIQGSTEDFAAQTSMMGDIYKNAFLVISAASGHDTESGFLALKKHGSQIITIPDHKRGPEDLDRVYVRPWISVMQQSLWGNYHASLDTDPVFTRAWCLQERLLATRIIHFTSNEMLWECRSCIACECGYGPSQIDYNDKPVLLQQYFDRVKERNGGCPFSPTFGPTRCPGRSFSDSDDCKDHFPDENSFWWMLVERFSTCRITEVSDRLPAIGGLARRMQSENLGGYYAGLWENDLPLALLWQRDGYEASATWETHSRPSNYIAPTWSWVSLIGKLQRAKPDYIPTATVQDVRCELANADHFGSLRSGYITITAPAAACVLQDSLIEHPTRVTTKILMESKEELKLSDLGHRFDLNPYWQPGMEPLHFRQQALCVLIGRQPPDRADIHSGALVLVESSKTAGMYERVGVLTIQGDQANWEQRTVTII